MLRIVEQTSAGFEAEFGALVYRQTSLPSSIESAARDIIADVRVNGDAALKAITERIEKRPLSTIEMGRSECLELAAKVSGEVRSALREAAHRIRAYHEDERYVSYDRREEGIRLSCRYSPMDRVGLYVPGGKARYPSTVLMTAVPAKVAGVREIIMTTPGPSPETMAAALEAGVDRVFLIGGAQAIAALAYGTETVPRVDKIMGPGNAYVAAAKRLVFGDVGIDMVAGPTEVVVLADASANPAWVAADLLAQAEHDELAVPVLIAVGNAVAAAVNVELERQLKDFPRRQIAEKALQGQGVAFVTDSVESGLGLLNRLAPEHAGLAVENAASLASKVTCAGAVFVGHAACESLGDYFAGPSHVLPTGGSARFSSPLGVGDFLKRTSYIEYDLRALSVQADAIIALANAEGLAGHARAVSIRAK